MRTNCNNCGAVLVDGKCDYCGARWFTPGITLGKTGYISEASFEVHHTNIDCTSFEDTKKRVILGAPIYSVKLSIVGISKKDMQDLHKAIENSFKREG